MKVADGMGKVEGTADVADHMIEWPTTRGEGAKTREWPQAEEMTLWVVEEREWGTVEENVFYISQRVLLQPLQLEVEHPSRYARGGFPRPVYQISRSCPSRMNIFWAWCTRPSKNFGRLVSTGTPVA